MNFGPLCTLIAPCLSLPLFNSSIFLGIGAPLTTASRMTAFGRATLCSISLVPATGTHIPPLERGYGSRPYSGIVDYPIYQLSLYLDQCAEAYDFIVRTIIRHPKLRKLARFHRVERDIDPSEHSLAIAGITALVDLFVEHQCGIVMSVFNVPNFGLIILPLFPLKRDFAL